MDDLNFDVEIRSVGGLDYEVIARSPTGEGRTTMRFPFDEIALKLRMKDLEIALLRSGGVQRRLDSPEESAVKEFGQQLFEALISGEVRSRFDSSLIEAEHREEPLRIQLRFDSPALAGLPWEFLFDSRLGEYLVLATSTPLVRYIELPEIMKPLTVTPPLRMLGVVSSPAGLAKLDVAREKTRIEESIKDIGHLIELHWLERPTADALQQALWRDKWHIFHFAGHGGFDPAVDEGVIALEDDQGNSAPMTARKLGMLLGGHQPLRLAVLNACEGARGSEHDLFSSTAATLVRRKTPAVVAMQFEISDRAAIQFGRVFYRAIADGLPVDSAVTEARKNVSLTVANSLEWGTPVLFMRSRDGVLFRVRKPKPKPEPAPAPRPTAPPPAAGPPPRDGGVPVSEPSPPAPPSGDAPTPGRPAGDDQPKGDERAAPDEDHPAPPPRASVGSDGGSPPPTPPKRPDDGGGQDGPGIPPARVLGLAAAAVIAILVVAMIARGGGGPTGSPSPSASAKLSEAPSQSPTEQLSDNPSTPPPPPPNPLKIAIEVRDKSGLNSMGVVEAVRLAISDVGGTVGGLEVSAPESSVFAEGANGVNSSRNLAALVKDEDVVAVVGPYTSGVTRTQIPKASESRLLLCSPSASDDTLTKGSGAADLRAGGPVSFVRTIMTNDRQGAATARFVIDSLGLKAAFVVDKGSGAGRADQFADYWTKQGAIIVGRQSIDAEATDYQAIVTLIKATGPDVVYYSGNGGDGVSAGAFLKDLRSSGLGVTFVTSGEAYNATFEKDVKGFADSRMYLTYPTAEYYASRPGFVERFSNPGVYALTAYSCAAAILDGMARTDLTADRGGLRDAIRSSVVDPSVTYQSPMGEFSFDLNGDSTLQIMTTYQYDTTRDEWVAIGEVTAP
jgi:ABC-type branched-subunit amino acid transport system substrate-binding protein